MKYSWLNLLRFGRTSRTISSRLVKNIVTIIFFVSIPCRILGTTSADDRANIFEHGYKCRNQDSSPVTIPSNLFLPSLGGFAASLLMLRHAPRFVPRSRNEAPSGARTEERTGLCNGSESMLWKNMIQEVLSVPSKSCRCFRTKQSLGIESRCVYVGISDRADWRGSKPKWWNCPWDKEGTEQPKIDVWRLELPIENISRRHLCPAMSALPRKGHAKL
jgi:hypothetical protein